jgi:ribosomal protein L37AE/L43A
VTTALETYLGWEELQHLAGCPKPAWSVDVRTDLDELRKGYRGEHTCPNEECGHSNRYERTTVRIVCRSCQAAVVIRGEDVSTSRGMTVNTTWGYGQKPRTMAGLLLWPGEPWLDFGRLSSDEPYDYVVTRTGVKQVTEADVVGIITQRRGKRGGTMWEAGALPAPGKYARLNWTRASGDKPLRTVAAAAKWIAAQLEAEGGGS